jgi:hypothetical protein
MQCVLLNFEMACRYVQSDLDFMWQDGSKWLKDGFGFWAALIIANVPNGISKVEQDVGGSWVAATRINQLGQQWELERPDQTRGYSSRSIPVRVYDHDGKLYGTYDIAFNCPDSGTCGKNTPTTATKI